MTSASARYPLPSCDDETHDLAEARRTRLGVRQRVHLEIPRDTHYLALIRRIISDLADLAGFKRPEIDKIELAVDEACSNAIVYQVDGEGEGKFDHFEIDVTVDRPATTAESRRAEPPHARRRGIEIVLRDRGDPYPFQTKGNIDLEDHLRRLEPGGLGIYIIKNFMDEVSYEHGESGNTLTMVKYLG
jgi:serine/threonine-protein kinase RsbW